MHIHTHACAFPPAVHLNESGDFAFNASKLLLMGILDLGMSLSLKVFDFGQVFFFLEGEGRRTDATNNPPEDIFIMYGKNVIKATGCSHGV